MQIKFIGGPQYFETQNKDLKGTIQTQITKLGQNILLLQAKNIKTAKLLVLFLNWERIKSNDLIYAALHKSYDRDGLNSLFKKVHIDQIEQLPSLFVLNRKLLDDFVKNFTEADINNILEQQSNIQTLVYNVITKGPTLFEVKEIQRLTPPQAFYGSSIIRYEDLQIERTIVCINIDSKIKQFARPRKPSDQKPAVDSFHFIRKIVDDEHAKSRYFSRIVRFLVYLFILIPISSISVLALYHSSNQLYIKRLNWFYGQRQLKSIYNYSMIPFSRSSDDVQKDASIQQKQKRQINPKTKEYKGEKQRGVNKQSSQKNIKASRVEHNRIDKLRPKGKIAKPKRKNPSIKK